jgi:hypothetical protein
MPYQDSFLSAVNPDPQFVAGRWVSNPLYYLEPQDCNVSWAATTFGANSWVLTPFVVPQEAYFNSVNVYLSGNLSATNGGSSRADSVSLSIGIYSINLSSLSLLTSQSYSTAFTITGSSSTGSYHGLKQLPLGISAGLNPGAYWFGIGSNASSAGAAVGDAIKNVVFSFAGNQSVNKGIWGSASAGSHQVRLGAGVWSVTNSTVGASIALSDINGTNQGNTANPVFNFYNQTA